MPIYSVIIWIGQIMNCMLLSAQKRGYLVNLILFYSHGKFVTEMVDMWPPYSNTCKINWKAAANAA